MRYKSVELFILTTMKRTQYHQHEYDLQPATRSRNRKGNLRSFSPKLVQEKDYALSELAKTISDLIRHRDESSLSTALFQLRQKATEIHRKLFSNSMRVTRRMTTNTKRNNNARDKLIRVKCAYNDHTRKLENVIWSIRTSRDTNMILARIETVQSYYEHCFENFGPSNSEGKKSTSKINQQITTITKTMIKKKMPQVIIDLVMSYTPLGEQDLIVNPVQVSEEDKDATTVADYEIRFSNCAKICANNFPAHCASWESFNTWYCQLSSLSLILEKYAYDVFQKWSEFTPDGRLRFIRLSTLAKIVYANKAAVLARINSKSMMLLGEEINEQLMVSYYKPNGISGFKIRVVNVFYNPDEPYTSGEEYISIWYWGLHHTSLLLAFLQTSELLVGR